MVTFSDLRDAETDAYKDIAKQWRNLASELQHTAGDITRQLDRMEDWCGEAADAAREYIRGLRDDFNTAADAIEKDIPNPLCDLSDTIESAQNTVKDVISEVDADPELSMDGEGEVIFVARDTDEQMRSRVEELNTRIGDALSNASDADQEAVQLLKDDDPEDVGLKIEGVRPLGGLPDLESWDPERVNQWWESLDPWEQESLIHSNGELIGGIDGIPVEARDRANRIRFAEEFAEVSARRDALNDLDDLTTPQENELQRLEGTDDEPGIHGGMEAIHERLNTDPAENTYQAAHASDNPDSYLLDFSTQDDGRGIVATGNPDTSENTVTNVPGVGADLGSMEKELGKADQILDAAEDDEATGDDTAAVTWIGYDTPPNVAPNGMYDSYAEDAAPDLANFQEGLNATHEGKGDGHNTVIGHSYGSTVIGQTAQDEGLNVDNSVHLGSPGVNAHNASDLGMGDNVYVSSAENDIIREFDYVNGGHSPVSEEFGAQVFRSDEGTEGWYRGRYSADAHSEYWDDGNEALDNISTIVTDGDDEDLSRPEETSDPPPGPGGNAV